MTQPLVNVQCAQSGPFQALYVNSRYRIVQPVQRGRPRCLLQRPVTTKPAIVLHLVLVTLSLLQFADGLEEGRKCGNGAIARRRMVPVRSNRIVAVTLCSWRHPADAKMIRAHLCHQSSHLEQERCLSSTTCTVEQWAHLLSKPLVMEIRGRLSGAKLANNKVGKRPLG